MKKKQRVDQQMLELKGLKTNKQKNWPNYTITKSTIIQVLLNKNTPSNGSLKCEEKTMVD